MIPSVTFLQGDVLEQLATLPDESVHCVVTSPPYWGLRDYGSCSCGSGRFDLGQGDGTGGNMNYRRSQGFKADCPQCHGTGRVIGMENQIGLEKTPEEYVAKMVEVFREVRRVLRSDGVCWINLGSSYAQSGMGGNPDESPYRKQATNAGSLIEGRKPPEGFKPKDMIPIPWMVAMALQRDGWWLRQDIIWHKPNPMPESVTDRCTKSHEYIFLFSKKANYFYDAEAIKEPATVEPHAAGYVNGSEYAVGPMNRNGHSQREGDQTRIWAAQGTRNKRSVWTVPSQAYDGAHFATFPEDLIKPCILAGTSAKGCCPKCGAPWERVVEATSVIDPRPMTTGAAKKEALGDMARTTPQGRTCGTRESTTLFWLPLCGCGGAKQGLEPVPCTILDPFAGSFTTCAVSMELGRNSIGIELNPQYVELGRARCAITPGLNLA